MFAVSCEAYSSLHVQSKAAPVAWTIMSQSQPETCFCVFNPTVQPSIHSEKPVLIRSQIYKIRTLTSQTPACGHFYHITHFL